MGDSSIQPKDVVFVTGFGPFGQHIVNSSWEGVRTLGEEGLGHDDVELRVLQIPVKYDTVRTLVPELWAKHKPKLMVHVGVSGIAKEITLEQQAHNDNYDKPDIVGALPADNCCVAPECAECVASALCMGRVCEAINDARCGVDAVVSTDPGRYLCDFIYYTSLNVDRQCSAFIHVPPLDKPYNRQQLAQGLRLAINAMLLQLQ